MVNFSPFVEPFFRERAQHMHESERNDDDESWICVYDDEGEKGQRNRAIFNEARANIWAYL